MSRCSLPAWWSAASPSASCRSASRSRAHESGPAAAAGGAGRTGRARSPVRAGGSRTVVAGSAVGSLVAETWS